jgi:LPS export ABC transporter protein LptC
MSKKLLYIVKHLILILLISIQLMNGCDGEGEKQGSQPPADVKQEVTQFSLVQMRNGQTRWKLNTDLATFLESNRIKLNKTELLLLGAKDNETLTIRSLHGEVDQRTKDIKMEGNVGGTYSSGGQFFAQEAYWSESRGKIYTLPGVKVKMIYKDSVIYGEELEADPKLETANLKNVEGTANAEENINEK